MRFDALCAAALSIQATMLQQEPRVVRIDTEARLHAAIVSQVSLCGDHEFRLLKYGQAAVAAVAQDPTDRSGLVVVVDVGAMKFAVANSTLHLLRLDHPVKVIRDHAVSTQSISQCSFRIEHDVRFVGASLTAGFESGERATVAAEPIDRQHVLAGRTVLHGDGRLREQLDLALACIAGNGPAGPTETSHAKTVAWISLKGRQGLVDLAAGADLHRSHYTPPFDGGA